MSDSDSDSDIDEEAIAAERAALRAASSAADAPLPPPAAAPSASADALGGRRGASSSERQNAAKRALELNLQFQQMCQDELKSIAVSLRLNEAAREQAKRAFQICASLQNRVDGRSAAGKAVRAGAPARGIDLDDAKPRCRLDFVPFFSCPRNGITDQPEPNEDARWKEELDRSFPNAPSVKGWSREERLDLRCAIAGQLKHEYHKQLLQRMQDAASAAERAEAKQLLHAFTTADTEGDAFLKERQSAQEAMGMPLGTDGTPLAWARVQEIGAPSRAPFECQIQWTNIDDPRLRLFLKAGSMRVYPEGREGDVAFTPQEAHELIESAKKFDEHQWGQIARELASRGYPGRTAMACLRYYRSTAQVKDRKVPWANDEDELLLRMVQAEGDANWVRVSAKIEGRTPEACLHRWRYSVDPSIRRGKWTEEEDARLERGVAQNPTGAKDWCKWVDGLMAFGDGTRRTPAQARERWVNSLDPFRKQGGRVAWTADEDRRLRAAYEEVGGENHDGGGVSWADVCARAGLEGRRTGGDCKMRWVYNLGLEERAAKAKPKSPWTPQLDAALLQRALRHVETGEAWQRSGVINWSKVFCEMRELLAGTTITRQVTVKNRYRRLQTKGEAPRVNPPPAVLRPPPLKKRKSTQKPPPGPACLHADEATAASSSAALAAASAAPTRGTLPPELRRAALAAATAAARPAATAATAATTAAATARPSRTPSGRAEEEEAADDGSAWLSQSQTTRSGRVSKRPAVAMLEPPPAAARQPSAGPSRPPSAGASRQTSAGGGSLSRQPSAQAVRMPSRQSSSRQPSRPSAHEAREAREASARGGAVTSGCPKCRWSVGGCKNCHHRHPRAVPMQPAAYMAEVVPEGSAEGSAASALGAMRAGNTTGVYVQPPASGPVRGGGGARARQPPQQREGGSSSAVVQKPAPTAGGRSVVYVEAPKNPRKRPRPAAAAAAGNVAVHAVEPLPVRPIDNACQQCVGCPLGRGHWGPCQPPLVFAPARATRGRSFDRVVTQDI